MVSESVNVVYKISIITGIGCCVTLFLFYLSRIAVFLNKKRFKYAVYAVWSVCLILLLLLIFLQRNSDFNTRVSYFPLFDNTNLNTISYADAANMFTAKACIKDVLVYPVDWYYSSFNPDSIHSVRHIARRAKKFGLDYLILVSIEAVENPQVRFVVYNTHTEAFEDSLFSPGDDKSILMTIRKISEMLKIELEDTAAFKAVPPVLESVYSRARRAQLNGDYKRAVNYFKKCLSMKDDLNIRIFYISALLKKGFERMRNGDSPDYDLLLARDALRGVEGSGCDNPYYNLLYAELYIYKEMWNKASVHLRKVFKYSRNIPEAYFYFSRLHKSRFKYTGFGSKIQLLERAVYLNPAYKEAWLLLAQNLFAKGFYKEAKKTYLELLSVIPECADAYLGLATIAGAKNDPKELFDIYKELISVNPNYGLPYYNLGILYWKTKDFNEAERFFRKAVSLNGDINSYFYLGLIESEKGNYREALKYFKKRVSLRTGTNDHFADVAADKIRALNSTEKKSE